MEGTDNWTINWTVEKLEELKKLYNKAKSDKQVTFFFEGKEILTNYSKYVIEYLEDKFKVKE